ARVGALDCSPSPKRSEPSADTLSPSGGFYGRVLARPSNGAGGRGHGRYPGGERKRLPGGSCSSRISQLAVRGSRCSTIDRSRSLIARHERLAIAPLAAPLV